MLKKLRDAKNNKSGFTMVELIVVIAIILILAAVLIPNLFKYIERSAQASCKNDAASALTQVQSDVADAYAEDVANGNAAKMTDLKTIKVSNVTFTKSDSAASYTAAADKAGQFVVGTGNDAGTVTAFCYTNGKHFINWTAADGWKKVDEK